MIHESSITLQSRIAGRLRVDPMSISGDRESASPVVLIPLDIELFKLGEQELFLDRLEAALWTLPGRGPRKRLGLPAVVDGTRSLHGPLMSLAEGAGSHHTQLRFSLDEPALWLLDRHVQESPGPVAELALVFEIRLCVVREQLT